MLCGLRIEKIIRRLYLAFLCGCLHLAAFSQSYSGIKIIAHQNSGDYEIAVASSHQSFKGSVHHSLKSIQNKQGKDSMGFFNEVSFSWRDSIQYKAAIKSYKNKPVVLFSLTLPNGAHRLPVAFPSFSSFPNFPYTFSYEDDNFAPPQFKLNETSTPWLFFDDSLNTFLISPASDFIVAKMKGDGKNLISSGLNDEIRNLPENFTHTSILVFGHGIQNTFSEWGNTLRQLYHRKQCANDADVVLKYFGYWTDNGADYYYNYDTTKGYAGTLQSLVKKYAEEKIPLGYLQLDSWWYEKSIYDYDGNPVADHKNPLLPKGAWNRYGGLMSYAADSFLFPQGLDSFQKQIGLSLVVHNRWIDPHSPYHDYYKIVGFAAIDSNYWNHILQPIHKAGVVCYEQDWLNYIYNKTPQMASDISVGNAFTDGMSNACKRANISMQYCMAMPRFFLQGLKYNNLNTIRTSGDRFEPGKWQPFLFTSQLTYEIGALPWCDVFKSDETGNMILAVLSAGAVGTGDAIGKENKNNILRTCRSDGVLIKPDGPALPIDPDYLHEAQHTDFPFLAYTYTKHNNITTGYLFAFASEKNQNRQIDIFPSAIGMNSKIAVFDPAAQKVTVLNAGDHFKDELPDELYRYYILAPITNSGIAFFGDTSKVISTGKQRIVSIKSEPTNLQVEIAFAKGEDSIVVAGYSEKAVTTDKGLVNYNPATHLFSISLSSNGAQYQTVSIQEKK